MSREFPSIENEESPEQPEQKLLRLLKANRGKQTLDADTKKLLLELTIEKENEVEQLEDPRARAVANIKLNLWWARLYYKAGYTKNALDNYEVAKKQAYEEYQDDLYGAIGKEIEELENSINK